LLVVEILSRTTRRRDHVQKRAFYLRIGVAEYWIVDRCEGTIRVIRPDVDDVLCDTVLVSCPSGAAESFRTDVAAYFLAALGGA
jgi:Uma2 family endonuclease